MKKIFLRSFYFIHLLCFNILIFFLLVMVRELFSEYLKIDEEKYLEIIYFIMIFLNILCSYFYVKAKIEKKPTIVLTIAAIIVKILILWIWIQGTFLDLSLGDDKLGIFAIFIIYGYIAYIGSLDVIFLMGLGVNLLIRRRNEGKRLDS